jgi:hypothetical protein
MKSFEEVAQATPAARRCQHHRFCGFVDFLPYHFAMLPIPVVQGMIVALPPLLAAVNLYGSKNRE